MGQCLQHKIGYVEFDREECGELPGTRKDISEENTISTDSKINN